VLVDGQPPRWVLTVLIGPDPTRGAGPSVSARLRAPTKGILSASSFQTLQPEDGGAFAFRGLPRDWRGTLEVNDHPFEGGRSRLFLEAPASGVELRVRSLPAISGRYVDADGEPLGGVSAFSLLRVTVDGQDAQTSRPFETARDGSFRVPISPDLEAPSGASTLLLEVDGRAYARTEIPRVDLAAGIELGDVRTERVHALEFHVRDSRGAPLAGARARVGPSFSFHGRLFDDSDSVQHFALTDERGVGVLAFAPERALELQVAALGHVTQIVTAQPGPPSDVVLEPLALLEVRLRGAISAQARLRVTAERSPFVWTDEGEAAQEQVQLGASDPTRVRLGGRQLDFDARDDGRFVLVGLRARELLQIEAQDENGRVLATRSVSLEPAEWASVELELAP